MDNPLQSSEQSLKAILLVDDDRALVESLRAALTSDNFLVDVAYDGDEAFLKVKVHQYDAVVCDMMMPKVRGDELYRRAVELNPVLAQRFLFITGHSDDQQVRGFMSGVPACYLLKPFKIQELIDAVRKLVS